MAHMRERLPHKQMPLHCAVTMWNPRDGSVLQMITDHISCREFCCTCAQACVIGDEYYATIEIGGTGRASAQIQADYLLLHCRVEVARSGFDARRDRSEVVFCIKEYSVTPVAPNWRASERPACLEFRRDAARI
jgi:hypothetical protein